MTDQFRYTWWGRLRKIEPPKPVPLWLKITLGVMILITISIWNWALKQ